MPATPKKIAFDDIRKGDTIRIVDFREVKVGSVRHGDVITAGGEMLRRDALDARFERSLTLVRREHKPLPTKAGTLIRLKNNEIWVLIEESAQGYRPIWVKVSNGTRQSVAFMQARANTADGFEVIA
ncbi:hypothetical protein SEA_DEJAVU_106 [Microbacterium Phage DejaVu]|nr:hypothetical protein SEA_DEJAVU_106 [Microbacterium Phage DejaVu]